MNISEYRASRGISQAEFAKQMTDSGFPATQGVVSMWERGEVSITAERCAQIERVTGGEISRRDLRPDLFGDLPPVAANDDASDPAPTSGHSDQPEQGACA
jgi:transcriptional regulator with XRE-family HTH domain